MRYTMNPRIITAGRFLLMKEAQHAVSRQMTFADFATGMNELCETQDFHYRNIHPILYEVNKLEIAEGRPMLSALVCNSSTGLPPNGFFECAKDLGRNSSDKAPEAFWRSELSELQQVWGQ